MGIKKKLIDGFGVICRLIYGVDKNKVVFVSFGGKTYSDNPRALSEELHKVDENIKIVWMFNEPEKKQGIVPGYVRCVGTSKWAFYKEILTAGTVVSNFSLYGFKKSKKQLFIQTWHGDKAFKKVLYDSSFVAKNKILPEEKAGYCDYAVAGSEYGKKQYESAFRYKGEILMFGTPRNDKLVNLNQQEVEKIRKNICIDDNVNILLYAPTLRREATKKEQQIQKIDLTKTLDMLKKRDNKDWVCLLRAHPAVTGLTGILEDERIIDVSQYEDMADLLLISDMLITDYSSCAGDFALLYRPIILFHEDKEEYLKNDRTFYFNIEDSPYFVADDQQKLEEIIMTINSETAKENCQKILEFYGNIETGRASEEIAKIIINRRDMR